MAMHSSSASHLWAQQGLDQAVTEVTAARATPAVLGTTLWPHPSPLAWCPGRWGVRRPVRPPEPQPNLSHTAGCPAPSHGETPCQGTFRAAPAPLQTPWEEQITPWFCYFKDQLRIKLLFYILDIRVASLPNVSWGASKPMIQQLHPSKLQWDELYEISFALQMQIW